MPTKAVSFNTPFDAEAEAISRRQRLAQALQQQAREPVMSVSPNAPLSWTQGVAKILQSYNAQREGMKADADAQDLAQRAEDRRGADMGLLVNALRGRQAQPAGLSEDASGNVTQRDAISAQSPMESLRTALPMLRDPQMQQAALSAYVPLAQQDVRRQQLLAQVPQQPQAQGNPMVPGQPGSSVMAGSGSSVPEQQPQQFQGPQWGGPVGGIPMERWLDIDPTGQKYATAFAESHQTHGGVNYDQDGRAFQTTKGAGPQFLNGITARDKGELVNQGGFSSFRNPYSGQPIGQPIPQGLSPADQYRIPLDLSKHFYDTGQVPAGLPGAGPQPQQQPQPAPQPNAQPAQQPRPAQAQGANVPMVDNPRIAPRDRAKLLQEKPQALFAATSTLNGLDGALRSIIDLERAPGLTNITGTVMGRTGNVTNDATNAQAFLDTLKSQLSVQELQRMRDASKTGGAVGNVTEKEWPRLEAQMGALQQSQSTAQFKKNLAAVKKTIFRMVANVQKAYGDNYGELEWQAPEGSGSGVTDFGSLNRGR